MIKGIALKRQVRCGRGHPARRSGSGGDGGLNRTETCRSRPPEDALFPEGAPPPHPPPTSARAHTRTHTHTHTHSECSASSGGVSTAPAPSTGQ